MSKVATYQESLAEILYPDDLCKKGLRSRVRKDQRGFLEFRRTSIQTGTLASGHGSAMVRQGGTCIVACIKAELCEPDVLKPNEGFCGVTVESIPNVIDESQIDCLSETTELITNVLRTGAILDLEQLCISPGKAAWCLYCSLLCIDYDGNVTDVALLALAAALNDLQLPQASYNEDVQCTAKLGKVKIDPDLSVDVQLNSVALCTTILVAEIEDDKDPVLLLDPLESELETFQNVITIICKDNKFFQAVNSGSTQLSTTHMKELATIAVNRSNELQNLIKAAKNSKDA